MNPQNLDPLLVHLLGVSFASNFHLWCLRGKFNDAQQKEGANLLKSLIKQFDESGGESAWSLARQHEDLEPDELCALLMHRASLEECSKALLQWLDQRVLGESKLFQPQQVPQSTNVERPATPFEAFGLTTPSLLHLLYEVSNWAPSRAFGDATLEVRSLSDPRTFHRVTVVTNSLPGHSRRRIILPQQCSCQRAYWERRRGEPQSCEHRGIASRHDDWWLATEAYLKAGHLPDALHSRWRTLLHNNAPVRAHVAWLRAVPVNHALQEVS